MPRDVASGEYAISVSMQHQPHYPNLRLRDLLSDDDLLAGPRVGRLWVTDREGR